MRLERSKLIGVFHFSVKGAFWVQLRDSTRRDSKFRDSGLRPDSACNASASSALCFGVLGGHWRDPTCRGAAANRV